jgi:hypothetical protein
VVEALIGAAGDDDAVEIEGLDGLTGFAAIRADPGGVSLKAMLGPTGGLLAAQPVGCVYGRRRHGCGYQKLVRGV